MSISLLESPMSFDFIGNGLGYLCKTNLFVQTQGVKAFANFIRLNRLTDVMTWKFYNPDTESLTTIYARTYIDTTKNEIQAEPVGMEPSVAVLNLATDLQKIPFFAKYYTASAEGNILTIGTREPINFNWNEQSQFPQAYGRNESQNGSTPIYREDFTINCMVSLLSPFEKVITHSRFNPDKDGFFEFETGKLIKPYIQTHLPVLPGYSTSELEITKFQVHLNESYTDNGNLIETLMYNDSRYALNGKLDYNKYPGYSILDDVRDNLIWLNSQHLSDYWDGQEQFLYFFNQVEKSLMKVKAKGYFTDLSEWFMTFDYIDNRSEQAIYHCIPVRGIYSDLAQAQKEMYKFEVWIEHEIYGTGTYTVNKVFNVIDKPMHVRQYAFLNKFGLLETFSAVSVSDLKLKTNKTIARHYLKTGYVVSDLEYSQKLLDAYNEIEMSTGSLGKELALDIQNALLSEVFYEIQDNQYLPCIIDGGTFDIVPESEDIVSIKFSYRRAYRK